MVEIARALVHKVKLLILDEPTAVISGREATLLFDRLRRLRDTGVSVIFISHRLEEVFELCDRVTVLKDGKLVGTRQVAEVTREALISMMVGRDLGELFPPKRDRSEQGTTRLSCARRICRSTDRVRNVSIEMCGRRDHRAGRHGRRRALGTCAWAFSAPCRSRAAASLNRGSTA